MVKLYGLEFELKSLKMLIFASVQNAGFGVPTPVYYNGETKQVSIREKDGFMRIGELIGRNTPNQICEYVSRIYNM